MHGLYMEWRDDTLPQIRTKAYSDNLNVSSKLSAFYLAPMTAFLVAELYFAFFAADRYKLPVADTGQTLRWLSCLVLLLFLISHAAAVTYMFFASRRDRNLLERHGALYPRTFRDYIEQKGYRARLETLFANPPPPPDPVPPGR